MDAPTSGDKDLEWLWTTLRTSTKPLTRKRMKKLAGQLFRSFEEAKAYADAQAWPGERAGRDRGG